MIELNQEDVQNLVPRIADEGLSCAIRTPHGACGILGSGRIELPRDEDDCDLSLVLPVDEQPHRLVAHTELGGLFLSLVQEGALEG